MHTKKFTYLILGALAACVLALGLILLPPRLSDAASPDKSVFVPGRVYSMHLAGFADRVLKVRGVRDNWLRVEDKTGVYWLNSDWILEFSSKN